MLRLSAFLLLILVCPRVDAFCFESAGAKYHIDPLLVKAIAIGESSLRPDVTNINRDKKTGQALSTDYGLMQVNSSHIASLIAQGYIRSSQDLLNRPCLNVQIGTWILAKHFQVCGISWNCLGSYNAG
ncbi:lytic transglycosylase domain-containing protein, partial [Salmonella enterica subsp. enterica serovar Bareilly]